MISADDERGGQTFLFSSVTGMFAPPGLSSVVVISPKVSDSTAQVSSARVDRPWTTDQLSL